MNSLCWKSLGIEVIRVRGSRVTKRGGEKSISELQESSRDEKRRNGIERKKISQGEEMGGGDQEINLPILQSKVNSIQCFTAMSIITTNNISLQLFFLFTCVSHSVISISVICITLALCRGKKHSTFE